ncbi:hypothetical protein BAnh1_03850 [Bartonella australis AUST/NH1]|uniref:DUF1254 domain-containing protein n=1 Tax=Bartonella australis (strain Aust/NH1) TaxID=1094489 RepID=M1NXR3_BARAA|nr:hypothetical protein [Bartonella australis]AGF74267.1 hypothetical protein BAnh1_03850 [Bartonella australis AUST/NH1]
MTKFIYAALLTSIGAVVVHICVLFLVPYYTQHNTWERLEKTGKYYQFVDLDPKDPIRRSADPLFLFKVCKFNLKNGPVHLTTPPITQFWSLSVYTYEGTIFYSINDQTAPNAVLNLIVGTPIQVMTLRQSKSKNETDPVLVAKKLNKGFAILRIFTPSLSTKKESEAFLSSATCRIFNE